MNKVWESKPKSVADEMRAMWSTEYNKLSLKNFCKENFIEINIKRKNKKSTVLCLYEIIHDINEKKS